jgi:ubiquinone biosynthesis protein UbiJ
MAEATTSPFDALKPIAGRAIESALNRLLALDADARAEVVRLEGRRIELRMDAPPLAMAITVRDGRLVVGPAETENEPDLAVRGTLAGLLSQLPFLRPPGGSSAGQVKIAGDADLARRLQKLAERFDPDWNLPFTEVFGDVLGVQIAQGLRAALRGGRDTAVRLARHGAEYLTEESRDAVGRAEMEAHLDDVDALRDRAERLAARITHLQRELPDEPASSRGHHGTDA